MEREEAEVLISGLTYYEKLMLRELLLGLQQTHEPERLLLESDRQAS